MAKKIIQMYDKYQSTTKVYPKVLEECLPEDYQGIPDTVETLEGTVENIPEVVANPTLAGTEGDLEGLQVGDTKYKIGGGKQLYRHCITILYATSYFITFEIINDNNTLFSDNWNGVKTYMTNNSLNGWNACLPATGVFKSGSTIVPVNGLCMLGTTAQVVHYLSGSNDPNYKQENINNPSIITDRVITL